LIVFCRSATAQLGLGSLIV